MRKKTKLHHCVPPHKRHKNNIKNALFCLQTSLVYLSIHYTSISTHRCRFYIVSILHSLILCIKYTFMPNKNIIIMIIIKVGVVYGFLFSCSSFPCSCFLIVLFCALVKQGFKGIYCT